ncbi:MAG TPA: hypothetical protein VMV46_04535 [Thermoanaerobaculia bacterium]|nr:hypothetical protein [Thermoanaerobaculia bacterium]
MVRSRFDRPRLGELLLEQGLLSASRLRQALDRQRLVGGTLGANLLEMGVVGEEQLLEVVGRQLETPVIHGDALADVEPAIIRRLPTPLARRYGVVPFAIRGNTLCLASSQPGDIAIENEIALATSCLTRTFLALDVRVEAALHKYYGVQCPGRILQLVERLDRGEPANPGNPATQAPGLFSLHPSPAPGSELAEPLHPGLALLRSSTPPGTPLVPREPPPAPAPPEAAAPVPARTLGRIQQLLGAQDPGDSSAVVEAPTDEPIIGTPSAPSAGSVRQTGDRAVQWLRATDDRDEIATILLAAGSPDFRRRLMLAFRSERVLGWKGDGQGIVPRQLAAVNFPVGTCSPFLSLVKGSDFWLGPLPPGTPSEQLARVLGGRPPRGCVIVPIRIGDRIAAFLYLDNGEDGVIGAPVGRLLELCQTAGEALARSIAKRKSSPQTQSSTA